MPIRAAQETDVKSYGWSTDVNIEIASFNGFTSRQNNKETQANLGTNTNFENIVQERQKQKVLQKQ